MSDQELDVRFTVKGEPATKARPRVTTRGGKIRTYTPDATKRAEASMASAFISVMGRIPRDERHMFSVEADFYCGTGMRRDVDNMLKLVLDGLNKIVWDDDHQVMSVVGHKHFVDENARTVVTIRTVGIMPNRKANCLRCGVEFPRPKSHAAKLYCSDDCRLAERRARRKKVCPTCGETFTAHSEARGRFCSVACRNASGRVSIPCKTCGAEFSQHKSLAELRPYCSAECSLENARQKARERRARTSPGTCAICGAGTSRKEYRRCNPCKLSGRVIP